MFRKYSLILITATFCSLFSGISTANVVAQMKIQQGINPVDTIYVKLFDGLTPLTVANFLNYANGGDYTNAIIHRSISDFVIQGGGFVFDSPNTFTDLGTNPPVANEFLKSNTLGTLAMAKLASDSDSATNEWFINIADNSATLDTQNGGFTVFGEVIANGMDVVDVISTAPTYNVTTVNPAFNNIPLLDYTINDDITSDNLIVTTDINERFTISTDFGSSTIINKSSEIEDLDFGYVLIGDVVTANITLENNHAEPLNIGEIANIDAITAPYQITADTCKNTTLLQFQACTLTMVFTPVVEVELNDTINIEFISLNLSYSLNIYSKSFLTTDPNIVVSESILDFGETGQYDLINTPPPKRIILEVTNNGYSELEFSSVDIVSLSDEFSINTTQCLDDLGELARILPGDGCKIFVFLSPESIGTITGTLTIITDDPDEPVIIIPLTGEGTLDEDGVNASVEDSAPNGGDGNYDEILDSAQSTIVSISSNNTYLTFSSDVNDRMSNFIVVDSNLFENLPNNGGLGPMFQFEFSYENLGLGPYITGFAIILPEGVSASSYYMYGPTSDNEEHHWYEYTFDESTNLGAKFYNDVTFTSLSGESVKRTVIGVYMIDGGLGDYDLTVNEEIIVQGTYSIQNNDSSSSSVNLWYLIVSLLLLSYLRFFSKKSKKM